MRIKKLNDEVINKIAAGEVVERPASVLKELLENSLDAEAKKIEIKIEKGGKRLIEVKDNGIGIHPDDVLESVGRYSTSKISEIDDIFSINTYGFRGEALSSISAVSKFNIITRYKGYQLGKELLIEGGVFKHLSDIGFQEGTLVRVKDLFFNVPARKKFLKSDRTELNHIYEILYRYAISRPDVHFIMNIDGKEQFNLPPSDILNRIKQLFPKADRILKIEEEGQLGKVFGFIVPDYVYGKGYIFVNKRPIKNNILSKLIKSKAGNSLFIIFIDLPPYFVDQNVHPAKIEVRFKKNKPVENLLLKAFDRIESFGNELGLKQTNTKYGAEFKIMGQIEDTFIVVYYDSDIYFIDQHVASERINYELLKMKYKTEGLKPKETSPIEIQLSLENLEKFYEIKDALERAGFRFLVGTKEDKIVITHIPTRTQKRNFKNFILKVLNSVHPEIDIQNFLGEIACEMSVESGDLLHEEEARNLLKLWLQTENPNLCPHGRPVYFKISIDYIKKKVGRK